MHKDSNSLYQCAAIACEINRYRVGVFSVSETSCEIHLQRECEHLLS